MASKAAAAPAGAKKTAAPSKAVVKRDNRANNYIAAIAVVTVLIVIACGLVIKALLGTIILDGKLIGYTGQAKSNLDTKLKNIPQLISNYNALGSNQQLLADAMPSTPDFPGLVSIAQALSADANVTLKSVSADSAATSSATPAVTAPAAGAAPAPVPAVAPVTPFDIDVDVTGSYAQIIQFFKDVQLSARPMKVVSTQISGDSTNLDVTATIQTYYQGPANTADQTETLK